MERSTVVINRTAQFYNQSATKTYEVEAGLLSSDEAYWIDQLLISYNVFRIEPDATNHDDPFVFSPILITDATAKPMTATPNLTPSNSLGDMPTTPNGAPVSLTRYLQLSL